MIEIETKYAFPCRESVKNRIVMSPMNTCQSNADGRLSDEDIAWFERRISGNFGMVVTGSAFVDHAGKICEGQIGIDSDIHIQGLSILAQKARENKCMAILQLSHGGLSGLNYLVETRSLLPNSNNFGGIDLRMLADLSDLEIEDVMDSFVLSALRAEKAGLAGIELQAADGYLIQQFLSTTTNFRKDKWGEA